MAVKINQDAKIYIAEFDMTGFTNQVDLNLGVEPQDNTVFGNNTRTMIAGLETVQMNHQGFVDFDQFKQDEIHEGKIGAGKFPITIGVTTGLENTPAYFFEGIHASYQHGAAIGAILPFTVTASGSGRFQFTRGTILEDAQTSRTTSASGTTRQVGAVLATEKLYAVLHCVAYSGITSLDVIVESDDAMGFASPTTQITFTQLTALGSQYATPVAGAITDAWWRATWTIAGAGSASFVVVIAIK